MDKETNFDFWQDHSIHYLEMALNTDRKERVQNPDGYGKRTGECGDTVEFFISVKDNIITALSYDTDGCMDTNACANVVAMMAEGKNIDKAWEITPEKIIEYLETLSGDHHHCAELSVGAIYLALSNYKELSRSPWKKGYGRNLK